MIPKEAGGLSVYQVVKRDGKVTEFEISKISKAITKAFEALEKKYHPSVIDMLALKVTSEDRIIDMILSTYEGDVADTSFRTLVIRAKKVLRRREFRSGRETNSMFMRRLWMKRNAGSNRSNTSSVSDMMLLIMPVPPTAEAAYCSLWQRGMASGAVA